MTLAELKEKLFANSISAVANIEPRDCAEMLEAVKRTSALGAYADVTMRWVSAQRDFGVDSSLCTMLAQESEELWRLLTEEEKVFVDWRLLTEEEKVFVDLTNDPPEPISRTRGPSKELLK